MPKTLTFTENFSHSIDLTRAVFFQAGETYEVDDELLPLVEAANCTTPDPDHG